MLHVEEYFDLQEVKSGEEITERTVFVATDEQEVLRELNEGYSHRGYKFLVYENCDIGFSKIVSI